MRTEKPNTHDLDQNKQNAKKNETTQGQQPERKQERGAK